MKLKPKLIELLHFFYYHKNMRKYVLCDNDVVKPCTMYIYKIEIINKKNDRYDYQLYYASREIREDSNENVDEDNNKRIIEIVNNVENEKNKYELEYTFLDTYSTIETLLNELLKLLVKNNKDAHLMEYKPNLLERDKSIMYNMYRIRNFYQV